MPPKALRVSEDSRLDLENTPHMEAIMADIKNQLNLAYNTSETDDIAE